MTNLRILYLYYSVCKDKYWNTVTPTKRNNTTRISPANAAYKSFIYGVGSYSSRSDSGEEIVYMGVRMRMEDYLEDNFSNLTDRQRRDIKDREKNELNFGGSFDGHDCHVERCQFCECINCRCED